jgi:hypothetical protein
MAIRSKDQSLLVTFSITDMTDPTSAVVGASTFTWKGGSRICMFGMLKVMLQTKVRDTEYSKPEVRVAVESSEEAVILVNISDSDPKGSNQRNKC